jgi:hypothetical protein
MIRKKDYKVKACFITAFEIYYRAMVENYPSLKDTCFIRKPISPEDLIERVKSMV